MSVLNCQDYINVPIDLSIKEYEIYRLLYINSNEDTLTVRYTIEKLTKDSSQELGLTIKKVNTIVNNLIRRGFVEKLVRGTRGNPTEYRIVLNEPITEWRGSM